MYIICIWNYALEVYTAPFLAYFSGRLIPDDGKKRPIRPAGVENINTNIASFWSETEKFRPK